MRKVLWAIASAWELVYKNLIGARFLPGSEKKLLRVACRTYKGPGLEVDGVLIKKGDRLAELHLSNPALHRYGGRRSPEWALYRDIIKELRLLGEILRTDNKGVTALCGITLFAPAAKRMGFTAREIPPGVWASVNYFWLRLLRRAFSPKEDGELKQLSAERKPHEVWISREKFLEKFAAF